MRVRKLIVDQKKAEGANMSSVGEDRHGGGGTPLASPFTSTKTHE